MSKRIFTKKQIKALLRNENVLRCSKKSITYSQNFKLKAIKEYNEQKLTSREIFKNAGFDLKVIGKDIPKSALNRWNKIFEAKGLEKLITETRGRGGGRSRTKYLTPADRIKRLETEVAYLKAENNFLAKLRANKKR
jgi:transposase